MLVGRCDGARRSLCTDSGPGWSQREKMQDTNAPSPPPFPEFVSAFAFGTTRRSRHVFGQVEHKCLRCPHKLLRGRPPKWHLLRLTATPAFGSVCVRVCSVRAPATAKDRGGVCTASQQLRVCAALIWTRVSARVGAVTSLSVPAHLHAASQRRLDTRSTTDTRRARVLVQGIGAFCPGTRISRGIEGRSPVGGADPLTPRHGKKKKT